MSAIVGLFHRNLQPASSREIEGMCDELAHRGPDGRQTWQDGSVAMGHQMQWITPESLHEKLPLFDNLRQLAITADARIDNREELIEKIGISVRVDEIITDSELILLAYDKWRDNCVDHLIGDYVFAIWDKKERRVFCATDPMGMRPIYYYLDDKLFAFASEIKALLTLPQIPRGLNEEGFAKYVVVELNVFERKDTCFKEIFSLTSGNSLSVGLKASTFRSHGAPDFNKRLKLKSESEYLEAFREVFSESVRCRTRSAFPVACLLSGGLDSSSIAGIAAKQLAQSNTQLIGLSSVLPEKYHGPEKDERYYIDLVRDQWNIRMSYVTPKDNGIYDNLEHKFLRLENPRIDQCHYLYQALEEAAKEQGVRIILDGFGGETSASAHGDGYFPELAWRGHWIKLTNELRLLSKVKELSLRSLLYTRVLRPFAPGWLEVLNTQRKHGANLCYTNSPLTSELVKRHSLNKQVCKAHALLRTYPSVQKNNEMSYGINQGYTTSINPEDGAYFYPYLDARLLQFCFSLPPELKVHNGWERYLIRAGTKNILPEEIRWRKTKIPFAPDHPKRLKSAEKLAREIISGVAESDPVRQYIDVPRISKMLDLLENRPNLSYLDTYSLSGSARIVQRGVYAIVFYRTFSQFF